MDMPSDNLPAKPRFRRRHSKAFKCEILTACAQPGISVAAVARQFQLNANLIHKWRKDAALQTSAPPEPAAFLPMLHSGGLPNVQVTVSFTLGELQVQWPIEHINQALPWLRALRQ